MGCGDPAPGGLLLGDCLGISQLVVTAFASLGFFSSLFSPFYLFKLFLTYPTNFLTVALLISPPSHCGGRVGEL